MADLDALRADGKTEQITGGEPGHSSLIFLLARPETVFANRRLQLDPYVVHPRAGGAAAAPRYQRAYSLRLPFEDRFDGSVGIVPNPAGDVA